MTEVSNKFPFLSCLALAPKLLYRFTLVFLGMYVIPNDLAYGFTESLSNITFWDRPIMWVGHFFFGWAFDPENILRSFDYRFELCRYIFIAITSLIVSSLWIIIDLYRNLNYESKLKSLAQTVIRYHVAFLMMSYGVTKIFLIQFGTMDIDTMESTIGDQSPMGFMWSFMSFSKTVNFFTGWMEFMGAVMLFFRKTTFLGALLLLVTLTSVVIMDIGYDVSVTLYAIQIFLLVVVLLSSQFKRLFSFIVLNKTTTANTYDYLFKNTRYRKVALVLKPIIITVYCYFLANQYIEYYSLSKTNKNSWFEAKHDVETFVMNKDTIPNSVEDTLLSAKKWKKIIFNGSSYLPESFEITYEDDRKTRYTFDIDTLKRRIEYSKYVPYWAEGKITGRDSTTANWEVLNYKALNKKEYVFEAVFKGDTIQVKTKAKHREDYNLIKYSGYFLLDLEKGK